MIDHKVDTIRDSRYVRKAKFRDSFINSYYSGIYLDSLSLIYFRARP